MTEKKPNHLIKENSPYLLQHAFNPVDWYPWGESALEKAKAENKLLIISIGYAACHWCHVMERESFEDSAVAEAMNSRFVSVKVDREERPDIDQVYMTAAYATTGRGGWPLNVIALPDQRPVFAGTYFPKGDWLYILRFYGDLYQSQPSELDYQAAQIAAGMKRHFLLPTPGGEKSLSADLPAALFRKMLPDLDEKNGGSVGAPKFPMPVTLGFLLGYAASSGNKAAHDHVFLTLGKMHHGGIYDHLGGGFCRYSVDDSWHVPHFEKMLYDNAQLVSLYAQGYCVDRKSEWKQVVEETIGFINSELTAPHGLFYASVDADSDEREGAFYVWTEEEIRRYLDPDPELFLSCFSCTPEGNWEHGVNVLRKKMADDEFALQHEISEDDLYAYLQVCRHQLFVVRENRTRPATDDKILTGWNALMISGLVDASLAFDRPAWLEKAENAAGFYRENLVIRKGKLWRNTRGGTFSLPGFLDDYALLTKAFLDLYQATFADLWLVAAEMLTNEAIQHFSAQDNVFFNLASGEEPVVVMKSAELSDNVIPASNSVMAHNLFVLGHLLQEERYSRRAESMITAMLPEVRKNPAFHANWASLVSILTSGSPEIQIVGENATGLRKIFGRYFLPGVLWSGGLEGRAAGLKERLVPGKTLIYVCRNQSCFPPVETVQEALKIIEKFS